MLSGFIAPLRRVGHALGAHAAPSPLAAGLALGVIIGLLPKGNLIALSLCVALFVLRVNRGLALAVAVFVSCAAEPLGPFTHRLGLFALRAEPLQSTYAAIYNLPLGPWLGFHNTVVMGSLLMGLYVAYPVYYLGYTLFARVQSSALPEYEDATYVSGGRAFLPTGPQAARRSTASGAPFDEREAA